MSTLPADVRTALEEIKKRGLVLKKENSDYAEYPIRAYCPHQPSVKQEEFLILDCKEALFGGAAGGGKALHIDTPIATPCGWKTMGAILPGDIVFGMDGKQIEVIACSPVMYHRAWKLVFDDGSEIIADAGHKWLTWNILERGALTRLNTTWREKRRALRKSRSTHKKPWLTELNSNRTYKYRTATACIRTTDQIAESIKVKKRTNHSVQLAEPIQCCESELPISPYVLGLWLGDGTASARSFTTADPEIVSAFKEFHPLKRTAKYNYGIIGLYRYLRLLGLLNNKHIPSVYMRASVQQRLALLQGLMDTDGYCAEDGGVEFCNTNIRIANGVYELAVSLGLKPTFYEKRAMLKGKDCGPKYLVRWTSTTVVFRLPRKLERQNVVDRRTQSMRYIVSCIQIDSAPVRCIQVSAADGMFLAGKNMIPTHNSDALLMTALQFVHIPGYTALILRRTLADLELPDAIMDRAKAWLMHKYEGVVWSEKKKEFRFPSGARIVFGYLDSELDKFRYQSAAFQYIAFDELTQFTSTMYTYLFSRLRKPKGIGRKHPLEDVPLRMRAASNPGGIGHEWVKERFITSPGTRVFIPSLLSDNPGIDAESYVESLAELDPITMEQLLKGDWDILPEGDLFKRPFFNDRGIRGRPHTDQGPFIYVRCWDTAATEPHKANPDPDWTVGLLMAVSKTTRAFYILNMIRARKNAGDVEKLFAQTAYDDGREVTQLILEEPGSSGKIASAAFVKAAPGMPVESVRETGDKYTRAKPVAAQAQIGNIYFSIAEWNGDFFREVCSFTKDSKMHDDIVDAMSGAFAYLAKIVKPLVMKAEVRHGDLEDVISKLGTRPTLSDHQVIHMQDGHMTIIPNRHVSNDWRGMLH